MADRPAPSNHPRNNCVSHFAFSSFISEVANGTTVTLTLLSRKLISVLTCRSSTTSGLEQLAGIGTSRPHRAVAQCVVSRASLVVSMHQRPHLP